MSTVYGYLDLLIDEKVPNPVERIWVRYTLILHQRGRIPFAFLPKKAKAIFSEWEDEMKGGVRHECC